MTPDALKAIRQRLGLTQRGLAGALGISRAHYQDLEAGKRAASGRPAPIARHIRLALAALELGLRDHPGEDAAWTPSRPRPGHVKARK